MSRHSTHDNRMEMELEMFSSLCALVYQIDQGFNPDGDTMDAARRAINGWDDYWNDTPTVVDAVSPEVGLANVRALRAVLNSTPPTITQRHWDEPYTT